MSLKLDFDFSFDRVNIDKFNNDAKVENTLGISNSIIDEISANNRIKKLNSYGGVSNSENEILDLSPDISSSENNSNTHQFSSSNSNGASMQSQNMYNSSNNTSNTHQFSSSNSNGASMQSVNGASNNSQTMSLGNMNNGNQKNNFNNNDLGETNKIVTVSNTKSNVSKNNSEIVKDGQIFNINSLKHRISKAMMRYLDEYKSSEYSHISDTMFMTVNNKNVHGHDLKITHVVIDNPGQIKKYSANGGYGRGLENISSAKDKNDDWVVGFNGSHYALDGSGRQDFVNGAATNGVAIVNGKFVDSNKGIVNNSNRDMMLDSVVSMGNEICIDKKGNMFTAPAGISARKLIDDYGVVNTYASFEEKHLENGIYYSGVEGGRGYNRTYLCMKKPGDYYVVQGYGTPNDVVTYIKDELGCVYAKSLDQGGSVSMATSDQTLVKSEGDNGRAVADFLYFSD